jgi:hypothetical protein
MQPASRYLTACVWCDKVAGHRAMRCCWSNASTVEPKPCSTVPPRWNNQWNALPILKRNSCSSVPRTRATLPCQRTRHVGGYEMEQWNKQCPKLTKPRGTRVFGLSGCSIGCSIIVEQWNKAQPALDANCCCTTTWGCSPPSSRTRTISYNPEL